MPIRIASPTLDLETVRGIEENIELAAGNDRQEPLFLWNDTLQKLTKLLIPI